MRHNQDGASQTDNKKSISICNMQGHVGQMVYNNINNEPSLASQLPLTRSIVTGGGRVYNPPSSIDLRDSKYIIYPCKYH